jgi:hypothetical protein
MPKKQVKKRTSKTKEVLKQMLRVSIAGVPSPLPEKKKKRK